MPKFIDLTGQKIGRLLIISRSNRRPRAWWVFKCDCGNTGVVAGASVHQGTKSCGCIQRDVNIARLTKHGHAPTVKKQASKSYNSWRGMKSRCKTHPDYGGRGIKVCERWAHFKNFLEDMGERPIGGELDRIDVNGNYEPGNCRWVDDFENNRNKRNTRTIEFKGERKCMSEWCEIYGINFAALFARLKNGWTVEKALTTPLRGRSKEPPISG